MEHKLVYQKMDIYALFQKGKKAFLNIRTFWNIPMRKISLSIAGKACFLSQHNTLVLMDHFFRGWQLTLFLLSALQILPQSSTWMTSPSPTNIRWLDLISLEWGLVLLLWADLPVITKSLQLFTVSMFCRSYLVIVACCVTKLSWKKTNVFVPLKNKEKLKQLNESVLWK